MNSPPSSSTGPGLVLGRYALHAELAAGGMATVHLGRLMGPVGFARTVAIKRLHAHFAKDPEFVSMFLDEARLAGRIRHPNVVPVLDVVAEQGELFLVMDYIHGDSLSKLLRQVRARNARMPIGVVVSIMAGALQGLHAAHDTTDERGEPLQIVHRDISPQNIMVGADGVARVADFGIAKAAGRTQSTRDGQLKGKLGYMAPEQLAQRPIDRRTDVYSASVVLWEALAGKRLFEADEPASLIMKILQGVRVKPSKLNPEVPPALDAVVMKGLTTNPNLRYQTARDMAFALEDACAPTSPARVGEWVEQVVAESLQARNLQVAEVESLSSQSLPPGMLASMAAQLSASAHNDARHGDHSDISSGLIVPPGSVAAPQSATSAPGTNPSIAQPPLPVPSGAPAAPHRKVIAIAAVAATIAAVAIASTVALLIARPGAPVAASAAASAPSPAASSIAGPAAVQSSDAIPAASASATADDTPILPGATAAVPSASAVTPKTTKKTAPGYGGPAPTGKAPAANVPGFDDLTRR